MWYPKHPPSFHFIGPYRGIYTEGIKQYYNASLTLSSPAREELLWWQERLAQWNGKALVCQSGDKVRCIGEQFAATPRTLELGGAGNALGADSSNLSSAIFLEGSSGNIGLLQLNNQTAVAYDLLKYLGMKTPVCLVCPNPGFS